MVDLPFSLHVVPFFPDKPVMVDGYCYKDGNFMIHTNQGQGGSTDGWYDFYKQLFNGDSRIYQSTDTLPWIG